MELWQEAVKVRQNGMEKAASIWEILETLPTPIEPANIYKAVTSVKSVEFADRVRGHRFASALLKLVVQFLNESLVVIGVDAGSVVEGARAQKIIANAMPLTDEIYNDPVAYATRQHVYDGLLLLAAAQLGKEVETKKCIDNMHEGVTKLFILEEAGSGFDPAKVDA
jgi:hypothetical protein